LDRILSRIPAYRLEDLQGSLGHALGLAIDEMHDLADFCPVGRTGRGYFVGLPCSDELGAIVIFYFPTILWDERQPSRPGRM